MKMNSFKKLKKLLEPILKETREYKRLNSRKFNPSNQYANYKDVVLQICSHLLSVEECLRFGKHKDATYINCTHAFFQAMSDNGFGVYALQKELLLDFVNTDAPEEIIGLPRPFKRALILLPKDFITSHDGISVNRVMVEFIDPPTFYDEVKETFYYVTEKTGAKADVSEYGKNIDVPLFRWTSVVGFDYLYSDTFAVPYPGESYSYVPHVSLEGYDEYSEMSFLSKVSNILFLLILLLQKRRS